MTRIERKKIQQKFNLLFHLIHQTCHMHKGKPINVPREIVKEMEKINKELKKVRKEFCPACMAIDVLSEMADILGLE